MLDLNAVKSVLQKYYTEKELVNPNNQRMIQLDERLKEALGAKDIETMARDDVAIR